GIRRFQPQTPRCPLQRTTEKIETTLRSRRRLHTSIQRRIAARGVSFSPICEYANVIVAYFDVTTCDMKSLRLAVRGERKLALAEFSQQSGVIGQDAHIAVLTGDLC